MALLIKVHNHLLQTTGGLPLTDLRKRIFGAIRQSVEALLGASEALDDIFTPFLQVETPGW